LSLSTGLSGADTLLTIPGLGTGILEGEVTAVVAAVVAVVAVELEFAIELRIKRNLTGDALDLIASCLIPVVCTAALYTLVEGSS
jgi:hypothetical protein